MIAQALIDSGVVASIVTLVGTLFTALLTYRVLRGQRTGNGHPLGEVAHETKVDVGHVRRELRALGQLVIHHIKLSDDYLAADDDPDEELRRLRYLADSKGFMDAYAEATKEEKE